ncbi:MAG TPA: ATP-binding protein [Acetobacteraceae bacterium]|nr:ATP-binding protein [Acetobacteraceae bacterium]
MTLACAEQDDVLRIDSASPGDLDRLHPWFDAVSGRMPPTIRHGMRVALEEVVLNAANHGFTANAPGEITVRLQIGPLSAALCVEDSGRPFDPAKAPARPPSAHLLDATPGQLGLVLLHHYCHDLTYERVGQRNRLIMRFPFPAT